jgi:hypothetical protein
MKNEEYLTRREIYYRDADVSELFEEVWNNRKDEMKLLQLLELMSHKIKLLEQRYDGDKNAIS